MSPELLNAKSSDAASKTDGTTTPLAAFILAENNFALRLVQTVHESLLAINRSLKANSTLSVSLMEIALQIANMKVNFPKQLTIYQYEFNLIYF